MAGSMRVAVITPYCRESPDVLRQCCESVQRQSYPCTHFLVADGHPQDDAATWGVQHLTLAQAHRDLGNTPRCAGSLSAMNQGFDALAFLDADNWYYPEHIEAMIGLHQRREAAVCSATRSIHRLDGTQMYVDDFESDGRNHVDTNCMFLTRFAFRAIPLWGMIPPQLAAYSDRIFWQSILARGYRTAHLTEPTVAYRTAHEAHYRNIGEEPPAGAKTPEAFVAALGWWRSLPDSERDDWGSYLVGSPGWVIEIGTNVRARRAMQAAVDAPPPADVAAENNRGVQLLASGDFVQAEAVFRRLVERLPEMSELAFNLAKALQHQNRLPEAEVQFRRAVNLRPTWFEARLQLANLFHSLRRLSDAEAEYRLVLEMDPNNADALNALAANVLNNEGRIDEARAVYRHALLVAPDHVNCRSNFLLNEQYAADVTPVSLAEAHADWDRRFAEPLRATWRPFAQSRDPERPLRIGFAGGDFFWHPVGIFLAPVLERLDPESWFTICYANQKQNDEMTRRLRRDADQWHWVHDLGPEALADRIREDGVDILIDTSGHTGRNCLLTFARKPAPVQLTWAGYVGTTGLSAIDYLIADRFQVPVAAEKHYAEKILRMPHDYLCYEPPAYAPAVGPLPARRNGHVTFGCFNNPAKIGPQVIRLWCDLLRRLPDARLVLKYHWFEDAGLRKRFVDAFAAEGVDARRLDLLGTTTHAEQLERYNQIDLALDPFPYSGGLTTFEASWMGVPVVTCPGETFASRHSLAHLSNIEMTDTIARDGTDYVELALLYASDLSSLEELRAGLRERMKASPLCDCDTFAKDFAGILRGAWRAWCG